MAIAASAGGLNALGQVLAALPAGFPAAVLIVLHISPSHRSVLAEILDRHSALPVTQAHDGEVCLAGHVYTAPPDFHLLITPHGRLSLTHTDRVRYTRPSADVLFQSVAVSCGRRAIAVVLSGSGYDGADGVRAIKRHGGAVIAQDQATSAHFGMPGAAILTGLVDQVLPLAQVGPALISLVVPGGTP